MCRPQIARELGFRSGVVKKRIGAIKDELTRMKRECVKHDMDMSALNIEHAETWMGRALRNWDDRIKW